MPTMKILAATTKLFLAPALVLVLTTGQHSAHAEQCENSPDQAQCTKATDLGTMTANSAAAVAGTTTSTDARLTRQPKLEDTHKEPEKHYLRNLLELSGVIAGGTTWYWVNRDRQVTDWDFPTWEEKLTFDDEIMIFDGNPFQTNYTWHTYAGGASHLLGRSNGLGMWESAAFGTGASLFWEYGIEAREKISVNDILMTNSTGLPTGEFFHRVGQYVNQGQEGFGWDVARWTVGLGHTAHSRLDKHKVAQDLTLTPDFRWYYSVDSLNFSRKDGDAAAEDHDAVMHNIGFAGSIVALDNYLEPGQRSQFFGKANFTDFSLRFAQGDGSSTRAEGNSLIAGWHYEDVPTEGEGGFGKSINLGTSIGYLYHREQIGEWQDRLGGLHIPGPAIEGKVFGNGWKFEGKIRGNYDLVGVNALSWRQFRNERPDEVGKFILKSSGYYYGFGPSLRVDGEFQISRFEIGGMLYVSKYDSIEGFERDLEPFDSNGEPNEFAVPDDMQAHGRDTFFDGEAYVRARVYDDAYLQFRFGRYLRKGTLNEYKAEEDMTRVNLEVGLGF
jgi:hypothetical protein